VFAAAAVSDWMTYVVTSFQLALAFPANPSLAGVIESVMKFMAIFAVTQIPLALMEGVVVALLVSYLVKVREDVAEVVAA
jgi:cobalt/nickel transport system permease protein